jgi:hypothetical protein
LRLAEETSIPIFYDNKKKYTSEGITETYLMGVGNDDKLTRNNR